MVCRFTIEDLKATYDAAGQMLVITIHDQSAIQIHPGGTPEQNLSDAQALHTLTIRLSPHATWMLGQMYLLSHQFGRQLGREPAKPTGAMN